MHIYIYIYTSSRLDTLSELFLKYSQNLGRIVEILETLRDSASIMTVHCPTRV